MEIEFADKTVVEINDYTSNTQFGFLHIYAYGSMAECVELFSNKSKTLVMTIKETNGTARFVGYVNLQSITQENGLVCVCMKR